MHDIKTGCERNKFNCSFAFAIFSSIAHDAKLFYNLRMDFTDFTASQDDAGRRLDRIIKTVSNGRIPDAHSAIRKNLIRLNGKKTSADTKVSCGDKITVASFLLKAPQQNTRQQTPLQKNNAGCPAVNTIFKNEHLQIVYKDAGINVQPGSGGGTSLTEAVLKEYKASGVQKSLSFKPGPLHRLDRGTSGMIAFPVSSKGARWFSEGIKTHLIKKIYIGIVEGQISRRELWTDYIKCDETTNDKAFHTVTAASEKKGSTSKEAVTSVIPLAYGTAGNTKVTLVQFNIQTGRKHQIRAQSSLHGHPLYGDSAYKSRTNGRFFLHAAALVFPKDNPLGLPQIIKADPPAEFNDFMHSALINWDRQLII